jgi:hypothetical protein
VPSTQHPCPAGASYSSDWPLERTRRLPWLIDPAAKLVLLAMSGGCTPSSSVDPCVDIAFDSGNGSVKSSSVE